MSIIQVMIQMKRFGKQRNINEKEVYMNLDLLLKLLETPSVSGHELGMQKMLMEELKDVDDVVLTHPSYNVVHGINPESKVKVLLLAHIDEIGLAIEKIEENGICKLTNIGAIKPYMYLGQHVDVIHYLEDGTYQIIKGVIGNNPEMTSGEMKVTHLNLDLGTTSKEETAKLVSIGDPVLHSFTYQMLQDNKLSARALDDKIGAYICTEVLKNVKGKTTNGVYFASTVGEETTGRGAKFATTMINPTLAISLDVGSSTDVRYRDGFTHDVKLGMGPIRTIASFANPILTKKIMDAAVALDIQLQPSVEISRTYTDMDNIYDKNGGIPSQLISIPLRYMHSSVEVCSLKDVEDIIRLLTKLILDLKEEDSFDPFGNQYDTKRNL